MVSDKQRLSGKASCGLYILGEGLHEQCGFSFKPYNVPDMETLPEYMPRLWLDITEKLSDHFKTTVGGHPSGYGIAHNIKTGVLSFVFGGKYNFDLDNKAALLLAGLLHDSCKDNTDKAGEHAEKAAVLADEWLRESEKKYPVVAKQRENVLDIVRLHDKYKLVQEAWSSTKDRSKELKEGKDRFIEYGTLLGSDVKRKDKLFFRMLECFSMGDVFERTNRSRFLAVAAGKIRRGEYETIEEVRKKKWVLVRPDDFMLCDSLFDVFVIEYNRALSFDKKSGQVSPETARRDIQKYDPQRFMWANRDVLQQSHVRALESDEINFEEWVKQGGLLEKMLEELRSL